MSLKKNLWMVLAMLAALGGEAGTVVFDDLAATLAATGEATCLLDVSKHTGVTLYESPSEPILYDFRPFAELSSLEADISFSTGFILYLK